MDLGPLHKHFSHFIDNKCGLDWNLNRFIYQCEWLKWMQGCGPRPGSDVAPYGHPPCSPLAHEAKPQQSQHSDADDKTLDGLMSILESMFRPIFYINLLQQNSMQDKDVQHFLSYALAGSESASKFLWGPRDRSGVQSRRLQSAFSRFQLFRLST